MTQTSIALTQVPLPVYAGCLGMLKTELEVRKKPRLGIASAILGRDPALTAMVLAYANAQCTLPLSSIPAAITVLAVDDLRQLFTQFRLNPYSKLPENGVQFALWRRYCVEVADVARALAKELHLSEQHAYTAGLLHGIGMVVDSTYAGTAAMPSNIDVVTPLQLLRTEVLPDLPKVGSPSVLWSAALLQSWGLPQRLTKCIADCEQPFSQSEFDSLAGLLHLAIWRVTTGMAENREALRAATYPAEVALLLGMDMDLVLQQDAVEWA